jgi:hypothetical protein
MFWVVGWFVTLSMADLAAMMLLGEWMRMVHQIQIRLYDALVDASQCRKARKGSSSPTLLSITCCWKPAVPLAVLLVWPSAL